MIDGVLRRDGDAVGAGGVEAGAADGSGFGPAIKMGEVLQVDILDVAADAAFGEGERHPGLEMLQHLRVGLGMRGEIEIQAVGPGGHQRLQPGGALRVTRLQVGWIDIEPGTQILHQGFFALGLA